MAQVVQQLAPSRSVAPGGGRFQRRAAHALEGIAEGSALLFHVHLWVCCRALFGRSEASKRIPARRPSGCPGPERFSSAEGGDTGGR
jgi:hypothetical protein